MSGALGAVLLFAAIILVGIAIERMRHLSAQITEGLQLLRDINGTLTSLAGDANEIRVDAKRIRRVLAGASHGEMADNLRSWDPEPAEKG
jgi:hypothetical protein